MAHIMFVRALTVLLFLTTAANAGSMKELALIALLGGGNLTCGDAYLEKGQIGFEDGYCEITTVDYAICYMEGGANPPVPPELVKIEFTEHDGTLTIFMNGKPVGTCG